MEVIRSASQADAQPIATLHVRAWQVAYAGQLPDSYLANLSVERRERAWRQRLGDPTRSGQVVVAELNTAVVGFASVGPNRDPDVGADTGELLALYVHPDYWRRGTGRRLQDAAVEALGADGYRVATLWVLASNSRAQRFYERSGWQPDGTKRTDTTSDGLVLDEIRYVQTM